MTDTANQRGLIPTAGAAAIVAIPLVSIVFLIAQATTDSLLVTPPGGDGLQQVQFADMLVASVAGILAGTGIAWLMNRFVGKPRRSFLVLCGVSLGLYAIVPFAAAEELATGVWLNLMHLAVAIPVVGSLASRLPAST